jgi:hypothetical protein
VEGGGKGVVAVVRCTLSQGRWVEEKTNNEVDGGFGAGSHVYPGSPTLPLSRRGLTTPSHFL